MLRLSMETAPRWLDLPHGVRVEVRPLTFGVEQAARTEVEQRIRPMKQEAEDAAEAGQPLDPAGANGANAAWLVGQSVQFHIEALARYGIIAWQGLSGDDGDVLPLSPAAFAAFAAHPELGPTFYAAYREPLMQQAAEGNASAPISNGGGGTAPITAMDAMGAPNGRPAATAETVPSAPAALGI
jgi:hypothetical protein